MKKAAYGLICALLAVQTGVAKTSPEVQRIEAYCKTADAQMKRNPAAVRVFADVSDATKDEASKWREFKTKAEKQRTKTDSQISSSAKVWRRSGKLIIADFSMETPSGDWTQFITYYFREDGTLAKVDATLNTFHGNVRAHQSIFYDANGKVLDQTEQYSDLKTQRRLKGKPDFEDQPIPSYMNVRKLPFASLL